MYVYMGTICLHELAQREKVAAPGILLFFSFIFYFLVAEEKGSGRTYDTTDG